MRLSGNSSQNQILDQTIDAHNNVTFFNKAAEQL